jgi:homoserine O-acetyltransferase
MVKAQKILLDSLGIRHLKAIIGGSMGGMQALRFAVDFPGFCEI